MSRTSGLTGSDLLATIQAEENRGLSPQQLAVVCGYVTSTGVAKTIHYKAAVADASELYVGKTQAGEVPAQRGGSSTSFKVQKNGILVAAQRFLKKAGCAPGDYATVLVLRSQDGSIDLTETKLPDGNFVLICKDQARTDAALLGEEVGYEEDDEEYEEDEDEDEDEDEEVVTSEIEKQESAPVSRTTIRIPQPA